MANQQLVDYVKGQMMAGVSETDIRKILKDAGWPDAEVEEGMKAAKPASSATSATASPAASVSAQPAAASSSASSSPFSAKPTEPIKTAPKEEPKKSVSFNFGGASAGMTSMSASTPAVAGKKDETKPMSISSMGSMASMGSMTASAPMERKNSALFWIISGVLILALAGVGFFFYSQANTFSAQVDSLTASNEAMTSELASLRQGGVSTAEQANTLRADFEETQAELNMFVVTPNASGTIEAQPYTVKGIISSLKTGYSVKTVKGIVFNIKKDAKVDAVLKPIIGSSVTLSGMHAPGSFDITVTSVNGMSVEAAAQAAAAANSTTTASTTKPASASTSTTP